MSRLTHSIGGSIRSMQISRKRMFVFVEGALDRTFHDQLLRSKHFNVTDDFEIRAAKELPGGTGGKIALTNHFRALRKKKQLAGTKFGKRFTTAFIFDKDIDDLSRKKIRSPHAIYTGTYDLEGHLITCGDFIQAISVAAGTTYQQAQTVVGTTDIYLNKVVLAWADWIALCILSQLNSIALGCTYDRPSPLNPGGLGNTDVTMRDTFLQKMAQKLNLSNEEMHRKFNYYVDVIKSSVGKKRPLRFFKGKWMRTVLQEHTAPLLQVPGATLGGIGDRVMTALVARIAQDSTCACCVPFYAAFNELTEALTD